MNSVRTRNRSWIEQSCLNSGQYARPGRKLLNLNQEKSMARFKNLIIKSVCILFTFSLFSVGSMAAEKELKMASWGPAKHFLAVMRVNWVKEVNEQLKGKYKIIDYPGGQLYGPKDVHKAVAKGLVDMGIVLQPRLLSMVPMLEGAYLPFAYDDLDQVLKAYSGESMKIIDKAMARKRMKIIWVGFTDGVQFWSNKGSINDISDFKGTRLLSTSPMVTRIFASLGASPDTSIPLTEQYMALKRGVADASLDSTVNGFFQKKKEVSPYITKMNLSFATILLCVNLRSWQRLPEEAQQAMLKSGRKITLGSIAYARGWEKKFTGALMQSGATVTTIPPAERNKIKKIASSEWKKWADKHGSDARKLLKLNVGM